MSYDVIQRNFDRKKVVSVIDKTTFSDKSSSIDQCFHVQLLSQYVKREK